MTIDAVTASVAKMYRNRLRLCVPATASEEWRAKLLIRKKNIAIGWLFKADHFGIVG
jgi:hypothetical protein